MCPGPSAGACGALCVGSQVSGAWPAHRRGGCGRGHESERAGYVCSRGRFSARGNTGAGATQHLAFIRHPSSPAAFGTGSPRLRQAPKYTSENVPLSIAQLPRVKTGKCCRHGRAKRVRARRARRGGWRAALQQVRPTMHRTNTSHHVKVSWASGVSQSLTGGWGGKG